MIKFQNILFVSRGLADETDALKQCLSVAHDDGAKVKALVLCPQLPHALSEYQPQHEETVMRQFRDSLKAAQAAVGLGNDDVRIDTELDSDEIAAVKIVQRVLRDKYDLVIKKAEEKDGNRGFKALDMGLLRKCPAPVWLARPIARHRGEMHVAVAVDPETHEPADQDLSLRLLKLSAAIATTCSTQLDVVSCWDFEFEDHLGGSYPKHRIADFVKAADKHHAESLDKVIKQSALKNKLGIHRLRGQAEKAIPEYIENDGTDILVMGTVARSGIEGFIIGNTAENILQKIGCSLIALKPLDFVCPVKPF